MEGTREEGMGDEQKIGIKGERLERGMRKGHGRGGVG